MKLCSNHMAIRRLVVGDFPGKRANREHNREPKGEKLAVILKDVQENSFRYQDSCNSENQKRND